MLKNRLIMVGAIPFLFLLLLAFHCQLPQDPFDPSNTTVNVIFQTTDLIKNSLSITDSVGDTIEIGIEINLPENVDSLRLAIRADGVPVIDTIFKNYGTDANIILWKKICFATIGTKVVTLTSYSSIQLDPVVAVITIVPRSGPADTVNRAPKWNLDTLSAAFKDTALYTLQLSTYCGDPDGDSLTYSVLAGTTVGDTIKGNLYLFKATPAGKYVTALVATDPKGAKDTLFLALSVEASAVFTITYSGNGHTTGAVPVDSGR